MKRRYFTVADVASAACFVDAPTWKLWQDEWRGEWDDEAQSRKEFELCRKRAKQLGRFLDNKSIKALCYEINIADNDDPVNFIVVDGEGDVIWFYRDNFDIMNFD